MNDEWPFCQFMICGTLKPSNKLFWATHDEYLYWMLSTNWYHLLNLVHQIQHWLCVVEFEAQAIPCWKAFSPWQSVHSLCTFLDPEYFLSSRSCASMYPRIQKPSFVAPVGHGCTMMAPFQLGEQFFIFSQVGRQMNSMWNRYWSQKNIVFKKKTKMIMTTSDTQTIKIAHQSPFVYHKK